MLTLQPRIEIFKVMTTAAPHLNEAQKSILRAFSCVNTKEMEVKLQEYISRFFQTQVDAEMDKLWASGKWNKEFLAELKNAHYRTEYK